jgi:hypothetical protein
MLKQSSHSTGTILHALAAVVIVAAGVSVVSAGSAGAASTATLSRAPYVTDLTSTGAYVNWAIETQQTAGSVMIERAPVSGCPASLPWSSSAVTTPTTDPLNANGKTTVPWSVTVGTASEWQAATPVTGLTPGTPYCYGVYTSHSSSAQEMWPVQTFTTLDQPGVASSTPLTFDVLGDTGETQSSAGVDYPNYLNQGQSNIYSEIGNSGAKFLLMAGDVSYSGGTEQTYGDLNQVGDDTSDIFGPKYLPLAKGIPTYVADGNHGQTSDDLRIWPEPKASANGVYSYGAPPATVDGITSSSPSDWYAIQDGNVRIYVLDAAWADNADGTTTNALCANNPTYWTTGAADCADYQADFDQHWQTNSSEYKWLQADLAGHPGGVKMAVFHFPLRSDNADQATDPYLLNDSSLNPTNFASSLESLLATSGVKVVFNGHAHTYQDIRPTAPGTVANFVTGGGGGILAPVGTSGNPACKALMAAGSVYALGWNPTTTSSPGSACSNGNVAPTPTSPLQVFNYLKVIVNGSTVTVQAFNATGSTVPFDQATFNYGSTTPTSDFSIASAPTSVTATQGSTATSTISTSVTSGATQSVSLSATGAPVGATVSFNPPTITSGQSATMTVTTSPSTPVGSSTITVVGTGSTTHSAMVTLSVSKAPVAPTITSASGSSFGEGSAGTFALTSTGSPTPSLAESGQLPSGVSFTDNGNGTASLSGTPVAGSAGTYPLTFTASNGVGTPATQSFTLTVNAVTSDFSLAASPNALTVNAGSSGSSTISTTVTSGSAQSVALSASGAPAGALVSFSPQVITAGQTSTMSVSTASSLPTSTSTITVTGTGPGGSPQHSSQVGLTVDAATASTPAMVQSTGAAESAAATTLAGTFATPTKAGNLLVLSASVYTGATNPITSVTDDAGNAWTRVGTADFSAGHNSDGEMWYAADAQPASTVTVHVKTAGTLSFALQEYSGIATASPLDTWTGTSTATAGSTANSGSATPKGAGELAVGFVAGHGNAETITTSTVDPGFQTQIQRTSSGSITSVVAGDEIEGGATPLSFGGTFSTAMYWAAGIAFFLPSG